MPPGNAGPLGIDVSSNQGTIDWVTVSKTNLSFVFLRATVGAHTTDKLFSDNWTGVLNSGLVRGAYHFLWPLASAADQADNYITTVGALEAGDLPPVLDLEEAYLKEVPKQDVGTTIPQNQRMPMILEWLTRVKSALGRNPIIYSRQNFLDNLLGSDVLELSAYKLWIAHYTTASKPNLPSVWHKWTFWQYTEKGNTDGISGRVDLDRFNGTEDDLRSLT